MERQNLDVEEMIRNTDFDKLTYEQRIGVENIIKEIRLRKKEYPILDFKLLPHQKEIIDALAKRNKDGTPFYKYVIMM